jgi:hypothetical protein
MENKVKLTVDIPAELKTQFKIFCVKNRISMTEIVEELIRGYMDQSNEKEKGAS